MSDDFRVIVCGACGHNWPEWHSVCQNDCPSCGQNTFDDDDNKKAKVIHRTEVPAGTLVVWADEELELIEAIKHYQHIAVEAHSDSHARLACWLEELRVRRAKL